MVVVLGFGSGQLLTEIVENTSENTFVLLIEPDADLFRAILREADFSHIFRQARVSLSVGESAHNAVFIRVEAEYSVFTIGHFVTIENHWSKALYSSYFTEVKEALVELTKLGAQNVLALSHLGQQWQENIASNLPAILASQSVSALFGKYSDHPAVIVAAGPSLAKNMPRLSVLKGRCIIIAVDTAVRPLLGAGVIPDIVVSLDSQYENYLHLRSIDLPETLYALNPVVHPKIVEEHTGSVVFFSYLEPMFEWIEGMIGERGTIRSGGSVSTSAYDLAAKMGCSPIVMVGQDMAFSDNKTHVEGSNHEILEKDRLGKIKQGRKMRPDDFDGFFETKDIFGTTVLTSRKMDAWRTWFELVAPRELALSLNATEGGLGINGFLSISFDEASCRYMKASQRFDLNIQRSSSITDYSHIEQKIAMTRGEARSIKSICAKAIGMLENLPPEDMEATLDQAKELFGEIAAMELFATANRWKVDMALDKLEALEVKCAKIDDKSKPSALAKTWKFFFKDFYLIAGAFEKVMDQAYRNIKKTSSHKNIENIKVLEG